MLVGGFAVETNRSSLAEYVALPNTYIATALSCVSLRLSAPRRRRESCPEAR